MSRNFTTNNLKKVNKKTVLRIAVFCFILIVLTFSFPPAAKAQGTVSAAIVTVVGWITGTFAFVFGNILTLILDVLVSVARYNGFIEAGAVKTGWVIVRDLCNMFFILILLVIAFATILRVENYQAKRLLPKLLIMAVLINFSKTIAGLIIDFSQVIMLTFVNGFSQYGANNFIKMFQVDKYLTFSDLQKGFGDQTNNDLLLKTVLGLVAGSLALLITTMVSVALLAALVMRIVMLWVYVILSPLAFLLSAFPAGQSYSSRWWSDFTKQVVIGPVLAFFIWLALVTTNSSALGIDQKAIDETGLGKTLKTNEVSAGTALFQTSNFQTYIITIALLLGGLMVAQSLGGAAGAAAGKGYGWAKKSAFVGTGARFATERWSAFQGRREAERKGRAGAVGDKMFTAYRGVTQAPKAVGAVATAAAIRGASGLPLLKNIQEKYNERKTKKTEKLNALRHIAEAEEKLAKTAGAKWNKGGFAYARNKSGGIEIKNQQGERVKTLSKAGLEFRQAYKAAYSPAARIKDEAANKRASQRISDFGNLTAAELRKILNDSAAKRDDRLAASMKLAKDGEFKNEGELKLGQQIVSGFPSLKKDFDEAVDKRHGRWANTPEEFKAKVDAGVIDLKKLHVNQLEDNLDLIVETAGKEFGEIAKSIGARSKEAGDKLDEALRSGISKYEKVDTTNKEEMSIRRVYAGRTARVNESFGDREDEKVKFIKGANTEQLDKLMDVEYKREEEKTDEDKRLAALLKQYITKDQAERFKRSEKSADKAGKLEDWLNQREKQKNKDKEFEGGVGI